MPRLRSSAAFAARRWRTPGVRHDVPRESRHETRHESRHETRLATRRERGAVAVLAAIWLSVAIAALGVLDVGNVYFARRQLQRTADMAAMAGVQVISTAGACSTANTAAQQNASINGFTANGTTTTLTTTCGRWDTTSATHFGTSGSPFNAVQVQATQTVPYFFLGPRRNVTATATAYASNIDAFSLGTGIATINTQQSALLNAILSGLLKTSVSLSVGDIQSLATAQIKLQNLMVALGASTMQGLLSTTVSYQTLMLAMVKALQTGGDTINAAILQTVAVAVPGGQNITLGDNGTGAPGLLALGLANPNAAMTANINAFDALTVAAQMARRSPDGTPANAPIINAAVGLTGVAGVSLQVINPPVIAVGEAGYTTSGGVSTPRTAARTAAVNATITLLPVGLPPLTIGLPPLLSVSIAAVSTPIVIQVGVAPGQGILSSVGCESTKPATTATINTTPGIATLCLSGNSSAACSAPITVASIKASLGVLSGTVANIGLNPLRLQLQPGMTPLTFSGSSGSFDSSQSVNTNNLGSAAGFMTSQLLNALPGTLSISLLSNLIDISSLLTPILTLVGTTLTPLLQPVFALLDSVLVPTLNLLGAQIGVATVHNMSLTCGVSQLVN
ncbi:putative membrane protein [Paraburkholderia sp. GAS199]|uniref:TadG family pilus assembly protein n=1 Tax=Paraburkholderia sp. GAS199 TaxID=3035126 RepID=UPI003D23A1E3